MPNFCFIFVLLYINFVKSQYTLSDYSGEYASRQEYYNPRDSVSSRESVPSPGDNEYRTYVYNNRRYGTNPNRYNPYNPDINKPGGFPYHPLDHPYNPLNPNPLDEDFKYNTVSIIITLYQIYNKVTIFLSLE